MFATRGIMHIDADKIVHNLLQRDVAIIDAIAAIIPEALQGDRINRQNLAQAVAADKSLLPKLEAILHPRVRQLEMQAIACARRQNRRAILLDVPLLFESDLHQICDLVVTLQASPKLQWLRAKQRPGMHPAKFEALLARQLSDVQRASQADIVLRTDLGKAHTRKHVQQILKKLGLI
jgi:dephospho-CoA kinase